MIQIADLPHVTATLNGITAVFLMAGYGFIRGGRRDSHRACMLGAVGASVLFLVVYLIYHFNAGLAQFGGEGAIRTVYFTILIAHVAIAIGIVPLVPLTLFRALGGRFAHHKRIARWTLPLWLYVSVSGIVVYVMALHLYPLLDV